ncbi:hypothetical protein ACGFNU_40325 [Spirillospora sp. NPDC048911]|uniref:hypothetical protein n=1 Tax=Spirillospora sp. NPDC048911 TaxID=3364527 RepID=UPI00371FA6E0
MDLGLASHTIVTVVAVALFGVAAVITAIKQEQGQLRAQRRVAAEVGRLELAEIHGLLRQGMVTPHPQYWQVLEEGLVMFQPRDRREELQRQRLLQEVRLRLIGG